MDRYRSSGRAKKRFDAGKPLHVFTGHGPSPNVLGGNAITKRRLGNEYHQRFTASIMRKLIYLAVGGLSVAITLLAGVSLSNQGGRVFVQLQGQHLSVPEHRLRMGYPFWLEPLFRGEVDGIRVGIPIQEVAEHHGLALPRQFGDREFYISIPGEANTASSQVAARAWLGLPPYSGEAGIQETDSYYAVRHDESVDIWAVLLRRPDSNRVPPLSDFWIGLCTTSSGTILSSVTSCSTTSTEQSMFWYSFDLPGDLIPHIHYFRRYFDDQIASWAATEGSDI
jgi:hypothetical protein